MSIYNEFYNLIVEYVYGNPPSLDSFQQLVTTEISTIASMALVFLPVIVIFWLCKNIFSMTRGM